MSTKKYWNWFDIYYSNFKQSLIISFLITRLLMLNAQIKPENFILPAQTSLKWCILPFQDNIASCLLINFPAVWNDIVYTNIEDNNDDGKVYYCVYSNEDKKIFEEAQKRLQEGLKNIRENNTPPPNSTFLGFSDPVTIPNLADVITEYLNDQKNKK